MIIKHCACVVTGNLYTVTVKISLCASRGYLEASVHLPAGKSSPVSTEQEVSCEPHRPDGGFGEFRGEEDKEEGDDMNSLIESISCT
jgi:hypothetical protein